MSYIDAVDKKQRWGNIMKTKSGKPMTTAALAAAKIRKELKQHGISAKVRSSHFSMGDAVDVTIYDQLPAARKKIEAYCDQYQYGHFNGMQDLYEYSNNRTDIPQVKYVSVACEYSDSLKQAAYEATRAYYPGFDEAPESYADAHNFRNERFGEYADTMVYQVLTGYRNIGFWKQYKQRVLVQ